MQAETETMGASSGALLGAWTDVEALIRIADMSRRLY